MPITIKRKLTLAEWKAIRKAVATAKKKSKRKTSK